MKVKPIDVPPDVAAKCDDSDQGRQFNEMFSRMAANTDRNRKEPIELKPVGKPRKLKAQPS